MTTRIVTSATLKLVLKREPSNDLSPRPNKERYVLEDVTNADRAGWALFALGDFVGRTRVDDEEDAIQDLITNLLHLARGHGLSPERIANRALGAMEVELAEDEEGDMTNTQRLFVELIAQSRAKNRPAFR